MSATTVVILLLLGAAVLVIVLLLANASRGRRLNQDIPPAMRPAYSDDQLESRVLERTMGWGLALCALFAIFLPVYWLREPQRQTGVTEGAFVADFMRGEQQFGALCASCHGADATGGGAASTYDPEDSWPAPNLTTIVKRYEDAPIPDIEDYLETTIARGRPGTPMPAWGSAYGGPLTDQQVADIARWILANQVTEVAEPAAATGETGEELFAANCVRCHGDEGEGFIGPSLAGVFERHNSQTIMGILRNGIYLANGISMPPWQTSYMYEDARYDDTALRRIVQYLRTIQPDEPPAGADTYSTPYQGQPRGQEPAADATETPEGDTDGTTDA